MKRYYIVPDGELPGQTGEFAGVFHYIDLGSHGSAGAGHHVLMTPDGVLGVPSSWQPLPHTLDAVTTLASHGKGHDKLLADTGVLGSHTTFQAAMQLAKILCVFEP